MPKILLAGNDFRLLATRAALLARTKASLVCCNAVETMTVLQEECFDLVVLCHSLTEKQSTEIVELSHRKWPTTKILRIVSNVWQERRADGIAREATSPSDPAGLIQRTLELLQTRLTPQFIADHVE